MAEKPTAAEIKEAAGALKHTEIVHDASKPALEPGVRWEWGRKRRQWFCTVSKMGDACVGTFALALPGLCSSSQVGMVVVCEQRRREAHIVAVAVA